MLCRLSDALCACADLVMLKYPPHHPKHLTAKRRTPAQNALHALLSRFEELTDPQPPDDKASRERSYTPVITGLTDLIAMLNDAALVETPYSAQVVPAEAEEVESAVDGMLKALDPRLPEVRRVLREYWQEGDMYADPDRGAHDPARFLPRPKLCATLLHRLQVAPAGAAVLCGNARTEADAEEEGGGGRRLRTGCGWLRMRCCQSGGAAPVLFLQGLGSGVGGCCAPGLRCRESDTLLDAVGGDVGVAFRGGARGGVGAERGEEGAGVLGARGGEGQGHRVLHAAVRDQRHRVRRQHAAGEEAEAGCPVQRPPSPRTRAPLARAPR
eukprot:2366224-Rhodomonas_salina.2